MSHAPKNQQSNQTPSRPRTVAIVGLGLIGGSLAMAWKARGLAVEVVGVARRQETLTEALDAGVIDQGTLSLEEGVARADVVIIATPVRTIAPTAERIAACAKRGAVVTDVGSTKQELCERVWPVYEGSQAIFIGAHPMAGSERTGLAAADPYLFQNAPFVLVPPPRAPRGFPGGVEDGMRVLEELATAAGAITLVMSAAEHDAIVAAVSHLPHVLAGALVHTAAERAQIYPRLLELAAGGFRDTTRIAAGSEEIWTDICLTNAGPITEAIEVLEWALRRFREALESRDEARLKELLASARRTRRALPAKAKGILGTVFDAVVHVVDRPGAIHDVTGIIGAEGINIIDIEILRVREGEGGTLRLGFERESDLERAVEALGRRGYRVRRS